MDFKTIFKQDAISPIPARSIEDLELDDKVYKPDLEITDRFQGFSKELVRISLLGLGLYGFLIKMAADEQRDKPFLWEALRRHPTLAATGVVAFALCAACALFNGYLANKCLAHQLVISRYFGRLKGDRWDKDAKESFRKIIQERQNAQRLVLRIGTSLLFLATLALIAGAVLFGWCSGLVLFGK